MNLDPLYAFLQRLSARERLMLSLMLGAVLVAAVYGLVLDPLLTRQAELRDDFAPKVAELRAVQRMRDRYMSLLQQLVAAEGSVTPDDPADPFQPLKYIETAVAAVVSPTKIKSMEPQVKEMVAGYREEAVDLRLSELSLADIVDLMYRLEKQADRPLRITRLQMKKRPRDPYSFDVSATVSLLKRVPFADAAGADTEL